MLAARGIDDRCELYDLISAGEEASTLFLVLHQGHSQMRRLGDWWSVQNPTIISVTKLLPPGELPNNASGAVLSLRGQSLDSQNASGIAEGSLKRLLNKS